MKTPNGDDQPYEEKRIGKYTFLIDPMGKVMHKLLTGRRRDTKKKFRSDKKKGRRHISSASMRINRKKPKRKQRTERRKKWTKMTVGSWDETKRTKEMNDQAMALWNDEISWEINHQKDGESHK